MNKNGEYSHIKRTMLTVFHARFVFVLFETLGFCKSVRVVFPDLYKNNKIMVVAYLRVSTEKQFLANQREELLRFAEKNGLQIDKWYTETVSGSVRSKDRKLSGVLNRMQRGDSLIVTEISRLSRTMLEIMTILNSCIKKEIVLYSTKEGYVFQNDMNSKVLGFAFGLMAEIERNLISMRTKEALARRRQEGVKLGRKKGTCPAMRVLRENKRRLIKDAQRGVSCSELARQMGVSRTTMHRFLKCN